MSRILSIKNIYALLLAPALHIFTCDIFTKYPGLLNNLGNTLLCSTAATYTPVTLQVVLPTFIDVQNPKKMLGGGLEILNI